MARVYRVLLRLYPAEHRQVFGTEMIGVFERAAADQRGLVTYVRFAVSELWGVIRGAAAERMHTRRAAVPAASGPPADLAAAEQRVTALVNRTIHAIAHHDFETARLCSREETVEREKLRVLQEGYRTGDSQ